MFLVCCFACFQCSISSEARISLSLEVLSKSMKKYINEWTTTTLRFIILCPLLHTKSLINKLQSAILINTASSTSHLESHSSKGTLQCCLGWGHGPGEKRFSSHRQTIKLFSGFWFREKKYIKLYSYFHTVKICDKKSDLDRW